MTTVLLWACSFVVIRAVGDDLSPGALAFGRLVVGTCAGRRGRPALPPTVPRGRALAFVIGYGVLWFASYTVVLNWAERHLDAGTARCSSTSRRSWSPSSPGSCFARVSRVRS